MLEEVGDERIRAGGVVRRVRERQDVLIRADGESLDLAELGVLQLLAQLLQKVLPAFLIGLKRHPEALDRCPRLGGRLRIEDALIVCVLCH
jgi:hypothetical protein